METAAARKPDEKIKPRPAQLKTVVLPPSNRAIGAPVEAIGGENDDSSKAIIIAIISYNYSYN